jgi:hypothetical protein
MIRHLPVLALIVAASAITMSRMHPRTTVGGFSDIGYPGGNTIYDTTTTGVGSKHPDASDRHEIMISQDNAERGDITDHVLHDENSFGQDSAPEELGDYIAPVTEGVGSQKRKLAELCDKNGRLIRYDNNNVRITAQSLRGDRGSRSNPTTGKPRYDVYGNLISYDSFGVMIPQGVTSCAAYRKKLHTGAFNKVAAIIGIPATAALVAIGVGGALIVVRKKEDAEAAASRGMDDTPPGTSPDDNDEDAQTTDPAVALGGTTIINSNHQGISALAAEPEKNQQEEVDAEAPAAISEGEHLAQ